MLKEIRSVNNEYIKDICKLKTKKYRDEQKKFLIEGYHLIEMALDYIDTILISDMKDYNRYQNKKYIFVTKEIINKLSSTQAPQGIIAIVNKIEEKIDDGNILMLDNVQDPLNVGTLIRSALAFGIKNIVFSEDCVDIYNDKVIRGSQGSIFKINFSYCNLEETIKKLKEKEYQVFGTALVNGKELDEIKCNKYVLILGNEGQGIRNNILNMTDFNIYIPINKEIDSLNVSVAGSILMHELRKK